MKRVKLWVSSFCCNAEPFTTRPEPGQNHAKNICGADSLTQAFPARMNFSWCRRSKSITEQVIAVTFFPPSFKAQGSAAEEEMRCSQPVWEKLLHCGASTSLASKILEQKKSPATQLSEQMRDKPMCSPSQRPGSPVTILCWMRVHSSRFQDSCLSRMTQPTSFLLLPCPVCCSATNTVSVIALCILHCSLYSYHSCSLHPSSHVKTTPA